MMITNLFDLDFGPLRILQEHWGSVAPVVLASTHHMFGLLRGRPYTAKDRRCDSHVTQVWFAGLRVED